MHKLAQVFGTLFILIATLAGSGHCQEYASVRCNIIQLRAIQSPKNEYILLGDSLIDAMVIPRDRTDRIFNCGIGGAGLVTVAKFAPIFIDAYLPRCIFLCVGINDAATSNHPFDEHQFEKQFESLCMQILSKNISLIVSTLLPVQKGQPLGDNYFDTNKINSINAIIRKISKANNIFLVDSFAWFENQGYMPQGKTVDGVHLNAATYDEWRGLIFDALDRVK